MNIITYNWWTDRQLFILINFEYEYGYGTFTEKRNEVRLDLLNFGIAFGWGKVKPINWDELQ